MNTDHLTDVVDQVVAELAEPATATSPGRGAAIAVSVPGGSRVRAAAGPMSVDTPFHVASIGKLHTTVLLLQLLEQGSFGPGDPDELLDQPILPLVMNLGIFDQATIGRLHPDFGEVTMRHLLTHTSGWRDVHVDDANQVADPASGRPAPEAMMSEFGRAIRAVRTGSDDDAALDDAALAFGRRVWRVWDPERSGDADAGVLNRFIATGTAAAVVGLPGERFHYSDTGFMLLALILEAAGREPYHRQQRRRIIEPLGLEQTAMAYGDEVDLLPVAADVWMGGVPLMHSGFNLTFDWGGGGQVSSVDDLLTLAEALFDGHLLEQQTQALLLHWRTPLAMHPPRLAIGLGIQRWATPAGRKMVGHGGAWGGRLFRHEPSGVTIAGTTNQRDDGAWLDVVLDAALKVAA